VVVKTALETVAKLEVAQKRMEAKVDRIFDLLDEKKEVAWTTVVEKSQKQLEGLEERLNKKIEDKIKVVEVLCQSLPGAPTKKEVDESIAFAVKDKIEEDKEEEAEIAKRKTSVIVFGLSESQSEDTEERKMEDSCKISEMLHEMDASGVGVRQVIRLGARQTDQNVQPRPVKVVIDNEEQHQTMLKSAKNLRNVVRGGWNRVFVQPDLTPKQRTVRRQLVAELKERQLRGELNLIIANNKIITRRNVQTRAGSVNHMVQQQAEASPSVDAN